MYIMAKTYKHAGGYKNKRRTRKARRVGGMFDSLKTQMAKGAQIANQHYQSALKAAGPQAEKWRQQTVNQFSNMKQKVNPMMQRGMQSMQREMQQGMQRASPMMQRGMQSMQRGMQEGMQRTSPMMQRGMQLGMQSMQGLRNVASNTVNNAARMGERGVPQSNMQYGSPTTIATRNPTMM